MEEKIIGILGGMGPEATLDFFGKIIQNTPATRDQEHLRLIIYNNPKIPDRTEAILKRGESPVPMMVRSGRFLAKAGADFIVIPCISAHFFLEELRRKLSLPIISAFDEISALITREYPDIKVVGLLATKGTISGGLFQKRLLESGITTLIPEPDDQERVSSAIYKIKGSTASQVREESKKILIDVANHLIKRGSQGIIAGCTEIPLALKPDDVTVPLFDSLLILARAAVREAKRGTSVST